MNRFIMLLFTLIIGSNAFGEIGVIRQKIKPEFSSATGTAKTLTGEQMVLNLYLSRLQGEQTIKFELINQEKFNIGLLEFDFETFGNSGHIEFSSVKSGASVTKIFKVDQIKNPVIKNITVFDDDASERIVKVKVQLVLPIQTAKSPIHPASAVK